MSVIKLDLPIPPSINAAYVNVRGRGRVKSKGYKSWRTAALWEIVAQKPKPVTGPYRVEIKMRRPHALADCDNRQKLLVDCVVKSRVVPDDRNMVKVSSEWDETVAPGRALVIITSAES